MQIWKKCFLFYLGGAGYLFLEFLCRGWSHGSMFLLGGVCFLLIGEIHRLRLPLAVQLLISSAAVTLLELLTGLMVNRDYSVWDYRGLPFNFLGQICLNFSLLWIPVSLAAMMLYVYAQGRLEKIR